MQGGKGGIVRHVLSLLFWVPVTKICGQLRELSIEFSRLKTHFFDGRMPDQHRKTRLSI